jgi:hypothetical protein
LNVLTTEHLTRFFPIPIPKNPIPRPRPGPRPTPWDRLRFHPLSLSLSVSLSLSNEVRCPSQPPRHKDTKIFTKISFESEISVLLTAIDVASAVSRLQRELFVTALCLRVFVVATRTGELPPISDDPRH